MFNALNNTDISDAIAACTRALELDAANVLKEPGFAYQLALCYEHSDEPDKAIEMLEKTVEFQALICGKKPIDYKMFIDVCQRLQEHDKYAFLLKRKIKFSDFHVIFCQYASDYSHEPPSAGLLQYKDDIAKMWLWYSLTKLSYTKPNPDRTILDNFLQQLYGEELKETAEKIKSNGIAPPFSFRAYLDEVNNQIREIAGSYIPFLFSDKKEKLIQIKEKLNFLVECATEVRAANKKPANTSEEIIACIEEVMSTNSDVYATAALQWLGEKYDDELGSNSEYSYPYILELNHDDDWLSLKEIKSSVGTALHAAVLRQRLVKAVEILGREYSRELASVEDSSGMTPLYYALMAYSVASSRTQSESLPSLSVSLSVPSELNVAEKQVLALIGVMGCDVKKIIGSSSLNAEDTVQLNKLCQNFIETQLLEKFVQAYLSIPVHHLELIANHFLFTKEALIRKYGADKVVEFSKSDNNVLLADVCQEYKPKHAQVLQAIAERKVQILDVKKPSLEDCIYLATKYWSLGEHFNALCYTSFYVETNNPAIHHLRALINSKLENAKLAIADSRKTIACIAEKEKLTAEDVKLAKHLFGWVKQVDLLVDEQTNANMQCIENRKIIAEDDISTQKNNPRLHTGNTALTFWKRPAVILSDTEQQQRVDELNANNLGNDTATSGVQVSDREKPGYAINMFDSL